MKSHSNSGFTLLELLLATSILAIVSVIVLKLSSQTLDSWALASAKLAAYTNANIALDSLEQDLESASSFDLPHPSLLKLTSGNTTITYFIGDNTLYRIISNEEDNITINPHSPSNLLANNIEDFSVKLRYKYADIKLSIANKQHAYSFERRVAFIVNQHKLD